MIREIIKPYSELTKLEKERLSNYCKKYNVSEDKVFVYYCTDFSLGAGYDIVVSLNEAIIENDKAYFDDSSKLQMITDIDEELNNY